MRRGEHCLPVRRCRKHRAADDDNAAGNLERSWNGSREGSKHHSPSRIGDVQRHCLRRADGIDAFVIEEVGSADTIRPGEAGPVCFCAPHHHWEKGTSENANGLLRDLFPKGRSLDDGLTRR